MDKLKVVEELTRQLREQYDRALGALRDATEGATGDDTRAESKYDTRGLEASYLAAGQTEQADRLASELAAVEGFEFSSETTSIEPGALVTAELDGKPVHYLLAPGGGGITIDLDGEMVTVIGMTAPLREKLLGKAVGDSLDHPPISIVAVE